jgi:DNA repair exonuclease SbcCD nuclease subunit
MIKRLLMTDTHLGIYSDSDVWLNIVSDMFKYVADFALKSNIKEVVHLGDFFHNRKSVNTKTIDIAHNIAQSLDKLKVYMIVGNHDCYFKNTLEPTSLRIFEKYEHIKIVGKPMEIDDDVILVPWATPIPKTKCKFCLGHFAINGFHMNDNYVCKEGMETSDFSKFNVVLSGHFHTPSRINNIIYLGSPYAQTFHDAGGERGFYVFNEDEIIDYHIYNGAPKFIKYNTSVKLDEKNITGNVVKIIFDKDYGTNKNQDIIDNVIKHKPLSFTIDFTKVSITEEDGKSQEIQMENKKDIINNYIDMKTLPENINKPTLKGMFEKIMKEAEGV